MWILLAIFTVRLANINTQPEPCPKVCDACLEDSISCTNAAFNQIPLQTIKTIKNLILLNQQFNDGYLSRKNFSLSSHNLTLFSLTIRKSNIKLIKTKTFTDLKYLKYLDLTYNNDLVIQSSSFHGLNLTLLKLDHNDNLKLEPNSFNGLFVLSLHLSFSQISDIPYSLLKPILPSLTQLFLDHNLIVTIDPSYQIHFMNFKVLSLEMNPISCSCSMKWLRDVYLFRQRNGKMIKNAFSQTGENSPICSEPHYLKGNKIYSLSPDMFLCDPPTLTQLKIDFQSLTHTELSCSAIQAIDEASMNVEWFQEILQGIRRKLSSILNPIEHLMYSKKVQTKSILVSKNRPVDSFQCIANNVNGNTTATVRINWPPKEKLNEVNKNMFQNSNDGNQKSDEDNYLFQKRFTLLEMIGAVIGTFSLTLLIFFLIYKIIFINRQLNRKTIPPINGYTTYEAQVYSDSQTYDIPGNSYPQSVLLPVPHVSSTPDHFLDFKTQKRFYQTN